MQSDHVSVMAAEIQSAVDGGGGGPDVNAIGDEVPPIDFARFSIEGIEVAIRRPEID